MARISAMCVSASGYGSAPDGSGSSCARRNHWVRSSFLQRFTAMRISHAFSESVRASAPYLRAACKKVSCATSWAK